MPLHPSFLRGPSRSFADRSSPFFLFLLRDPSCPFVDHLHQNAQSRYRSTYSPRSRFVVACMTMHAPRLRVHASRPPIRKPQAMAVSHQLPWTTAKNRGTIRNALTSHSPTAASLKSLGETIRRQR